MPHHRLTPLSSPVLTVPHAMLNRHGGVSKKPYDSLNIGLYVGDRNEDVARNRRSVKHLLGLTHLVSARQVHGTGIKVVEDVSADVEIDNCDALVTSQPGVGLLIQQADCQAVLLHDPIRHVVAAIHCGWRGSVANIIARTITSMQLHFGVEPPNLRGVISPSLGPCCAEFVNFRSELPPGLHRYQWKRNYFDFWKISRDQLQQAGVPDRQIDITGICTCCSLDFFSYRRAVKEGNGVTGRNGSVIGLPMSG